MSSQTDRHDSSRNRKITNTVKSEVRKVEKGPYGRSRSPHPRYSSRSRRERSPDSSRFGRGRKRNDQFRSKSSNFRPRKPVERPRPRSLSPLPLADENHRDVVVEEIMRASSTIVHCSDSTVVEVNGRMVHCPPQFRQEERARFEEFLVIAPERVIQKLQEKPPSTKYVLRPIAVDEPVMSEFMTEGPGNLYHSINEELTRGGPAMAIIFAIPIDIFNNFGRAALERQLKLIRHYNTKKQIHRSRMLVFLPMINAITREDKKDQQYYLKDFCTKVEDYAWTYDINEATQRWKGYHYQQRVLIDIKNKSGGMRDGHYYKLNPKGDMVLASHIEMMMEIQNEGFNPCRDPPAGFKTAVIENFVPANKHVAELAAADLSALGIHDMEEDLLQSSLS